MIHPLDVDGVAGVLGVVVVVAVVGVVVVVAVVGVLFGLVLVSFRSLRPLLVGCSLS